MKRLSRQCAIEAYTGLDKAKIFESKIPYIRKPNEILVKVKSSSLNPLDRRMAEGYGKKLISMLRTTEQGCFGMESKSDFPLVLGRDFSGIVVDTGELASAEYRRGTEVFGATFPAQMGTHQEFIVVDSASLVVKPESVDHSTAACVPYAGLTAWSALVTTGGFSLSRGSNQRVLVMGGSGGVGSLATQLAVAGQAEVVAVAGPESESLLESFGATYLNYKGGNYIKDLISLSGFDIIIDCAGLSRTGDLAPLLRTGGCVVSLDSPLLKNTDSQGLLVGGLSSLADLVQTNIKTVSSGNTVRWAYFTPNKKALQLMSDMLKDKTLKPIIDKSFEFSGILDSYAYFTKQETKGKVVITM